MFLLPMRRLLRRRPVTKRHVSLYAILSRNLFIFFLGGNLFDGWWRTLADVAELACGA